MPRNMQFGVRFLKQPKLKSAGALSNKPELKTSKIQGKGGSQAARQGLRQKHQQVLSEGSLTECDTMGGWRPDMSVSKGKDSHVTE